MRVRGCRREGQTERVTMRASEGGGPIKGKWSEGEIKNEGDGQMQKGIKGEDMIRG